MITKEEWMLFGTQAGERIARDFSRIAGRAPSCGTSREEDEEYLLIVAYIHACALAEMKQMNPCWVAGSTLNLLNMLAEGMKPEGEAPKLNVEMLLIHTVQHYIQAQPDRAMAQGALSRIYAEMKMALTELGSPTKLVKH
jgi:hypothetical protein